ncbi:hypothetical protein K2173_021710 [Erythroxylum novogranatense]|uniref:Uncharacterized protein n=1 Tax=Erythroxylum novogranatense TaxID=1862640 RepID=A0AAV8TIZ7_9ROSI|nr:hypothetical protein K2173_021710 [Erythroxylum novogranatense]
MLGPGEAEFKKGQWRSKVKNMKATLTVRDFGGIGIGRKSRKCEGTYSTNFGYFVAMPSKWFENKKRCNKVVEIKRNGRTVTAEVVDECESDSECPNKNSIGASVAVWGALNIAGNIHAAVDVTWSDV